MLLRDATIEDFAFIEEHYAYKERYIKEPAQMVFTVALEQDNDVIAVGSLMLITAQTAWVYVDITTFALSHIRELVVNIQRWLNMMAKDLKLSRLQTWCDPDWPEAIRLLEHLGFVEEYRPDDFLGFGKSAILYVKFVGENNG